MKFFTRFDPAPSKSAPVGVSLTLQSPAPDLDVNTIVERYTHNHIPIPSADASAVYADVSRLSGADPHEAHHIFRDVVEEFNSMPPADRMRFNNDPLRWYSERVIDDARAELPAAEPAAESAVPVGDGVEKK